MPVGIDGLTPGQVHSRSVSVKFISKGRYRPVQKVQAVNSRGECTSKHGVGTYFRSSYAFLVFLEVMVSPYKECQWEFVRDSAGRVVYEKAYNKFGQLIWGLVYSPNIEGQPTRAYFVGSDGFPAPQLNSSAEFVEFEYSINGDEISLTYFDRRHHPQLGLDKVFGLRQEFYDNGLIRQSTSLDSNKQPMNNSAGYVTERFIYDEFGNVVEAAMFDGTGRPALGGNFFFHRIKIKYDERGNLIEMAFFDTAGQPTTSDKENKFHKITVKYDGRGNIFEKAFFDVAGEPTFMKEDAHRVTYKYDKRGNVIEEAYFDTAGQPTLSTENGAHRITYKYDEPGNVIEEAYFDTAGQPTLYKDSYHKSTTKYDDRGNQIEWAYFDTADHLVLLKDGYHKLTKKYDERGNRIEEAYFDPAGQPTLHKDGFHKVTAKYDERGNQIERACFDTAGQPTLHKDGFHKVTAKYDERGNQIERACFDTAGQPILHKDGFHKVTAKYDERGNQIERACFDTAGQPTLHKDGFHRVTIKYDEHSNQIEQTYFDTAGQKVEMEVVVTEILPNSRAENMGIRVGDVYTHYDGKAVTDVHLINQRDKEPANSPAKELRVWRDGKILSFWISPGKIGTALQVRPVHQPTARSSETTSATGLPQAVPSTPQPSH